MKTMIVDDRQLAVNAMLQTMKEIDPEGSHAGLIAAHEAILFAKDHELDVAFLDIEMPDMNGLLLAKELKEIRPELNIVFVTGHMEYAYDAHQIFASGYLMKPVSTQDVERVLANLRHPPAKETDALFIHCFGNFEVFYHGEPMMFKRSKSKELLAYLIDNKGAMVSMGELISALWEDGENSLSRNSQLRMFISDIRKTFEEAGLPDIILKEYNAVAVRTDKLPCDYFRFLKGDPEAVNAYHGEYMKQYSWSEMRIGELEDQYYG